MTQFFAQKWKMLFRVQLAGVCCADKIEAKLITLVGKYLESLPVTRVGKKLRYHHRW